MRQPSEHPSPARTRLTLRLKLTLWMVTIFIVIQLTVWGVVLVHQRDRFTAWLDMRLSAFADKFEETVRAKNFHVNDTDLEGVFDTAFASVTEPFYIILYDANGRVVASTVRPAPTVGQTGADEVLRDGTPRMFRAEVPGMRFGVDDDPEARLSVRRVRSSDGETYVLVVGRPDLFYESMLREARALLLLIVPAGVVAAGVSAWLISGLSVAPIRHLRRMAEALTPESIEQELEAPPVLSGELAGLEEELRQTRERLRQAFNAQDRFISSVSHELKTPIAVVLAESQTLPFESLPAEAKGYVLSVAEEMRRLGRMIESFLTLAKIKAGRGIDSPSPCNVNDFVMEAIADCSKIAAQYAVTISPSLDEGDPPPTVMGEAELLRVVVDNVVRNAVRFSPAGKPINIRIMNGTDKCEIKVRDFGPGIPSDMIEHIFDRFVQAPDEAIRLRGHGLGLSIAHGITELHNGSISVRNVPDGGCEFTITLPLAKGFAAKPGSRQISAGAPAA